MILTVLLGLCMGGEKYLGCYCVVTLFTFHDFLYCFLNNKLIFFILLLLACWQWRASSGFVLMVFWLHTSRRMRMMRRKSVPSSSLPKMEILPWWEPTYIWKATSSFSQLHQTYMNLKHSLMSMLPVFCICRKEGPWQRWFIIISFPLLIPQLYRQGVALTCWRNISNPGNLINVGKCFIVKTNWYLKFVSRIWSCTNVLNVHFVCWNDLCWWTLGSALKILTVYYVQEGLLFIRRFVDLSCFRDLVVAANRRSVDDHIVILGWFSDEDKCEALNIELSNDSWTPRIELQGIFSYIFYYENFKSQMSSFPENERMLCWASVFVWCIWHPCSLLAPDMTPIILALRQTLSSNYWHVCSLIAIILLIELLGVVTHREWRR